MSELLDPWLPFDYIESAVPFAPPPFVKDEKHKRRLRAYTICFLHLNQASRLLLADAQDAAALREYGDAAVIVRRLASSIMGNNPSIVVDGADEDLLSPPELPSPPPPVDFPAWATDLATRIDGATQEQWRAEVEAILDERERRREVQPRLQTVQQWLREWADHQAIMAWQSWRRMDLEAVGLGDSVAVVDADPALQMPTIEVYEPEAYAPVLDSDGEARTVHLWWFEDSGEDDGIDRVRRKTYRLVPIEEYDGTPVPLRYATPGYERRYVCLFSDAVYDAETLGDDGVLATGNIRPLEWKTVETPEGPIEANDVDLGYDVIPVVHLPNRDTGAHFGSSSLAGALQALDALNEAHTHQAHGGRMAARPPIAVENMVRSDVIVGPGTVVGGKFSFITTDLPHLTDYVDDRQRHISVLTETPDGMRGRVDPDQLPSGVAISLSFTPHKQAVLNDLRPTRRVAHERTLHLVQLVAIQHGWLEGTPVKARVSYGQFMPEDEQQEISNIISMVNAGVMSIRTAVSNLQALGLSNAEIEAEMSEIRSEDAVRALAIADALGPEAASEFMGRRADDPDPGRVIAT